MATDRCREKGTCQQPSLVIPGSAEVPQIELRHSQKKVHSQVCANASQKTFEAEQKNMIVNCR